MKPGITLVTIGSLALVGYIARMFFVIQFAVDYKSVSPITMNNLFSDYILFDERALLILVIAAIFLVFGILRIRKKKSKVANSQQT